MQGEHGSCRGRSGRSHLHIGVVQRGLHGHDEEVLLLKPGIHLALTLREGTEKSKKWLGGKGQGGIINTTKAKSALEVTPTGQAGCRRVGRAEQYALIPLRRVSQGREGRAVCPHSMRV